MKEENKKNETERITKDRKQGGEKERSADR